jgi:hypothetical protein
MTVGFVRSSVAELALHLFDRSLHPELFDVRAQTVIKQPVYTADAQICESGHVVTFRFGQTTVTEVVAPRQQPLPERKQVLHRRLKGCRDESIKVPSGIGVHVSYQVERLPPEVFLNMHQELLLDCQRAPLSHCFNSANRLSPAALSFIQADVWPHSLLIHAFHTFPDDCAIVKTQSLYEL